MIFPLSLLLSLSSTVFRIRIRIIKDLPGMDPHGSCRSGSKLFQRAEPNKNLHIFFTCITLTVNSTQYMYLFYKCLYTAKKMKTSILLRLYLLIYFQIHKKKFKQDARKIQIIPLNTSKISKKSNSSTFMRQFLKTFLLGYFYLPPPGSGSTLKRQGPKSRTA